MSLHPANFEGTLSHHPAAARAARDERHRVEAEGQQHRLLEPLVDDPCAAALLGDAHGTAVEQAQRLLDRVAYRTGGILIEAFTILERRTR